jgi:hypothetical protein
MRMPTAAESSSILRRTPEASSARYDIAFVTTGHTVVETPHAPHCTNIAFESPKAAVALLLLLFDVVLLLLRQP